LEGPGPATTQDLVDLWMRTYQESYARLMGMPPVGPLTEKIKTTSDSMNTSVNLYGSWMEMLANFQVVFAEGMGRLRAKLDEIDEGADTEGLNDRIYKLWIDTLSETSQEFLRSEQFSQEMGRFMSAFIDSQKANQEWLEQNLLKPMNLPTRTEMNAVNKEIYALRKEVKRLATKLESKGED
jgi:hypothetical protein